MKFENINNPNPKWYINAKKLVVGAKLYRILVYKDDYWEHSGFDTFKEYEENCPHGLISITIALREEDSEGNWHFDDHDFEWCYMGWTAEKDDKGEWIFQPDVYTSAVGEFMASKGLI